MVAVEKEGAALAVPSQGDEDGGSEMVLAGSGVAAELCCREQGCSCGRPAELALPWP